MLAGRGERLSTCHFARIWTDTRQGTTVEDMDKKQMWYEDGRTMEFERADGTPYAKTGVWAVGYTRDNAEDYFATQMEAQEYANNGY